MSRPPRPLFRTRTTDDGSAFAKHKQFLPIEFAAMVELEQQLAEVEARLGVTDEEGDFAYTLMELSALVGHTLGLYQNLYARDAYLGTAETARSLVLHARRLAYEPDRGLAASGFAVLTLGPGLKGRLPARFALSSAPRGEVKAQTFETLDALDVDAARNAARPVQRERPAKLTFAGRRTAFRLAGTGLNLAAGAHGLLVRSDAIPPLWLPVVIASVAPDAERSTRVEVEIPAPNTPPTGPPIELATADGTPAFRFLAMPRERLQRFGWDADPIAFPPSEVSDSDEYPGVPEAVGTEYGYEVTLDSGIPTNTSDVYLSASIRTHLVSTLVVARRASVIEALRVTAQGEASVAFRRGEKKSVLAGVNDEGEPVMAEIDLETQVAGTVSYVGLQAAGGTPVTRASLTLQAPIHADWQFDAEVLPTEANPDAIPVPLEVDADFGDFRPGGFAVFETLKGTFSQVVEVQRLTVTDRGTTELGWVEVTGPPRCGWKLDNLRVFGNVARVTHGETVEEVLGGSDGVTPFLRFALKKAPVTQVPGADGGEPAIEVRVNDVAWTRIDDFADSREEDRHYRLEVDEDQTTSVVFGSGRRGAIPPSGKKHIRAVYRQGLGAEGNAERGAVSRIKKAHPLIERALNPAPMIGGAPPAGLTDLRRQATRYIRTFDRAVSTQDHADLALLYPGVARAAARWSGSGIEVTVATADGGAPPLGPVEAFLNARRDSTLPLNVVPPEVVDLFLDLTVEHDPSYLTENVERAIQDALYGADPAAPGLFAFPARDFGQAAHLSEVYDRVGGVEGVTFVRVTRFRIEDEDGVRDVLQVNAHQWLRLPSANLSLPIGPGAPEQAPPSPDAP